jgi:V/A-type H+-transporting ATPase subunit K
VLLLVGTCYAPALLASEADSEGIQTEQTEGKSPIGLAPIGAALAIGLPAIATGIAQARIGAAGIGAIAENPKRLGMVIMLIAIPETVAILGFVIAYLIQS